MTHDSSTPPLPGRPVRLASLALILALALGALAAGASWAWFNRPVMIEESWNEPLASVSFAPFRRGQSPLAKIYPTPAQVEEDLRALQGLAQGVRTYTSREGLERVPEMASRLGLKVIQGAWLGSEVEEKGRVINRKEIDALIASANAYPNEVQRVIVGNEVLLRNDLKPDELIAYIREVKSKIKQPVSYADVWAFYLKYPEVAREVDYLTIHILPFWEDEPVTLEEAEDHVVKIVQRIRAAFPDKPILIGETGWPSLGRDRGPAHVNTVNAARFVRKMAALADQHGFDYNIVEAFDQPWKSALENTVGAAWGILDVERRAKFGMSGPVIEVPDWRLRAGIALLGGLVAGAVLGAGVSGFGRQLVLVLAAQALSWLAVTACFHAQAVSFQWWQDIWAPFRGALAVLTAWLSLRRMALLLGSKREAAKTPRWGLETIAAINGFYALIWTALLVVDGRYRDIPVIDFGAAALGILLLLGLSWATAGVRGLSGAQSLTGAAVWGQDSGMPDRCRARGGWILGIGLPLAVLAAPISEGLAIIGQDFVHDHPGLSEQVPLVLHAMVSNVEINGWAVMLAIMALPYLAARIKGRNR
ncbi:MAG: exo-beta-1,3-glucanase [Rhodospirillaceae bacterium]|nr:exo-beta-1,3-glucanase [Rhodospirillaceae bacterium]